MSAIPTDPGTCGITLGELQQVAIVLTLTDDHLKTACVTSEHDWITLETSDGTTVIDMSADTARWIFDALGVALNLPGSMGELTGGPEIELSSDSLQLDSEPHVDDRRMVEALRCQAEHGSPKHEMMGQVADRLEELARHDVILRYQRNKFDDELQRLRQHDWDRLAAKNKRHQWGELGQIPPGLPIDGGEVWFWIPGMPEAEPGTLAARHRPAPSNWECSVVCDVYGAQEAGDNLTDDQMSAAYFRPRYPVSLPDVDGDL